jgi:Ca2+-binding EF-hand superfamily protein
MTDARAAAKAEFERFDTDHDGWITAEEIRRLNQAMGVRGISDAEIEEAIRSADRDGDGRIGLEEFLSLVGGGRHELR